MQERKPTKNYNELPDTITPYDYAEWRGVGENTARNVFNSQGFPRLKCTGTKQLADKRAVLLYELGIENAQEILKEVAKEFVKGVI